MGLRRVVGVVLAVAMATAAVESLRPVQADPIRSIGDPSNANHGTVRVCDGATDCTDARRLVCPPALANCSPAATVRLSNFPATTVHVWLVKSEPDSLPRYDCQQDLGVTGRTHLGDTSASSLDLSTVTIPPGGWSYGPAWVCATTAGHSGGGPTNVIDEVPVVISPL